MTDDRTDIERTLARQLEQRAQQVVPPVDGWERLLSAHPQLGDPTIGTEARGVALRRRIGPLVAVAAIVLALVGVAIVVTADDVDQTPPATSPSSAEQSTTTTVPSTTTTTSPGSPTALEAFEDFAIPIPQFLVTNVRHFSPPLLICSIGGGPCDAMVMQSSPAALYTLLVDPADRAAVVAFYDDFTSESAAPWQRNEDQEGVSYSLETDDVLAATIDISSPLPSSTGRSGDEVRLVLACCGGEEALFPS